MNTLMNNRQQVVLKKRKKLLQELTQLQLLLRGSLTDRFSVCIRRHCDCRKGNKHGPRTYFTWGKNQVYVRKDDVKDARKGVEQYQRAIKILDEITKINLELLDRGKLSGDSRENPP